MKNYKQENVYCLNGVEDGYKVTIVERTNGERTWYEAYSNLYASSPTHFETREEMEQFYEDWMNELNMEDSMTEEEKFVREMKSNWSRYGRRSVRKVN